MPQSPKTTAHAFVDAINRRDVEKLLQLMADDHRFIDSLGAVIRGREKMQDGWAGYFRMVPDYHLIVDETFSDGAIVVMLGTAQGTYAKNGRLLRENFWRTPAAWRAQIQDGKIVEWRVYADNEPIQRMARSK